MVRNYYSVKDLLAEEFGDLIFAKNDAVASRLFAKLLKSNSTLNPDDLELDFIGTFNDESGVFLPSMPSPRKICIGDDTSDVDSLS